MSFKLISIRKAAEWAIDVVGRVIDALPREQVLPFLGRLLIKFVPYLEQRHFVEAGSYFRNRDADYVGPDDEGANILFLLGDRPDLVVGSDAAIEVPVPPGPEVDG